MILIRHKFACVTGLLGSLLALCGCVNQPSALERIHTRGELRVVTRNGPTTYYLDNAGPAGLEYDLASRFADYLGVKLHIIAVNNAADILPMIERGEADVAAAGLVITATGKQRLRYGPSYTQVTPQLVYRSNLPRPQSLADLGDHAVDVLADSDHIARLAAFQTFFPTLKWNALKQVSEEELLQRVAQHDSDYAVVDSNAVAISQRFNPELRVAFDLDTPRPVAWAFARSSDRSLYKAAGQFFAELQGDGTIATLTKQYDTANVAYDPVGVRTYLAHIRSRLPTLRRWFEQAGRETGLDWRLLAAIGYQESKWDARAVSPTGVRGVMMLTEDTADFMGLADRTDARASILGGARYFKQIKDGLPANIKDPVRTWMALAAYNLGAGHLDDARKLTEKTGGDPDDWLDLKKSLSLLNQQQWFTQTRLGYARGYEALQLVENVRGYYDVLSASTPGAMTIVAEEPSDSARAVAPKPQLTTPALSSL